MSALQLITGPSSEPLTAAEAKLHSRITISADDAIVSADIIAARQKAEHITGRALMPQTWTLWLDEFPTRYLEIVIPNPPLVSITEVKYIDPDGVLQTWSSAKYKVDVVSEPGRVVPVYSEVFPDTRIEINAVQVKFVCGYANAAAVPEQIKRWMLIQIANLYENRESIIPSANVSEAPNRYVDSLLDAYTIGRSGM